MRGLKNAFLIPLSPLLYHYLTVDLEINPNKQFCAMQRAVTECSRRQKHRAIILCITGAIFAVSK